MKKTLIIIIILMCCYNILVSVNQKTKINLKDNKTEIQVNNNEFLKLYNKYLDYSFEKGNGFSDFISNLSDSELKNAYADFINLIYNDLESYENMYFDNLNSIYYQKTDNNEHYNLLCKKYSIRLKVLTIDNFRSILSQDIEQKFNIPANQLSIYRIIGTPTKIEEILPFHSGCNIMYVTFDIKRYVGLNKINTTKERIRIIGNKEFFNNISVGKEYLINYHFTASNKNFVMITDLYNMFEIINNSIELKNNELNYEEIVNSRDYLHQNGISLYFFREKSKLQLSEFEDSLNKIINFFEVLK